MDAVSRNHQPLAAGSGVKATKCILRALYFHPFAVSSLLIPRLGLLSWVMRVSTIYDWVAIGLFAALIVLFLQRSTSDGPEIDTIWHYLHPSICCALVNYSGNEEKAAIALELLAGSILYYHKNLNPFS